MSADNAGSSFETALFEHARYAAARACARLGAPLSAQNLQEFLSDEECLRYPTRLVFDRAHLESRQFAQPVFSSSKEGLLCDLHIDPKLQNRPDVLYLAVAYMAAVINYGEAATPDLAEMMGALLAGMDQEQFYEKICEIADSIICPFE
jgi:hypothetical protein